MNPQARTTFASNCGVR